MKKRFILEVPRHAFVTGDILHSAREDTSRAEQEEDQTFYTLTRVTGTHSCVEALQCVCRPNPVEELDCPASQNRINFPHKTLFFLGCYAINVRLHHIMYIWSVVGSEQHMFYNL